MTKRIEIDKSKGKSMTPAFYNHLTHSYETPDKTTVAAEICDGDSPSDAFRAAQIREQQRNEAKIKG